MNRLGGRVINRVQKQTENRVHSLFIDRNDRATPRVAYRISYRLRGRVRNQVWIPIKSLSKERDVIRPVKRSDSGKLPLGDRVERAAIDRLRSVHSGIWDRIRVRLGHSGGSNLWDGVWYHIESRIWHYSGSWGLFVRQCIGKKLD